eukprot:gene3056-3606_t
MWGQETCTDPVLRHAARHVVGDGYQMRAVAHCSSSAVSAAWISEDEEAAAGAEALREVNERRDQVRASKRAAKDAQSNFNTFLEDRQGIRTSFLESMVKSGWAQDKAQPTSQALRRLAKGQPVDALTDHSVFSVSMSHLSGLPRRARQSAADKKADQPCVSVAGPAAFLKTTDPATISKGQRSRADDRAGDEFSSPSCSGAGADGYQVPALEGECQKCGKLGPSNQRGSDEGTHALQLRCNHYPAPYEYACVPGFAFFVVIASQCQGL